MEVKTTKKEVIASIVVTLDEADIEQIKKLVALNPCSDQGLFLKTILEKAETPVNSPTTKKHTSFWYVTICGNSHVLADAIGSIKSNLPNYVKGITSPANWNTESKQIYSNKCEACVGMWAEDEAKIVQKFLSGQGFECSMIKAGDHYQ